MKDRRRSGPAVAVAVAAAAARASLPALALAALLAPLASCQRRAGPGGAPTGGPAGAASLEDGDGAGPGPGGTLAAVRARGRVNCGVSNGVPGFSAPDGEGNWRGLDVDVCRAVAAAVFGDASRVRYTPLSFQQRFAVLQAGEIDLLSRTTTHTLTRDSALGLNFGPTTYYDGQGFMVKRSSGVTSAGGLDGATICIQQGTTTERNTADYFRANGMSFRPVVMERNDELFQAFTAGRCDAYTADGSNLAADRSRVADPEDLAILPETISKEPLGPAVRHGDDAWYDVVKWSVHAMVAAEEMGITSANAEARRRDPDPDVRRFLGTVPGNGAALGLPEDWAYNIVRLVGNYGESFERNVGRATPLGLERGLNALWTDGGLLYAPPLK